MQLFRTDRPLTPSWDLIRPSLLLLRNNAWPIFYLSFLPSLISTVGFVLLVNHFITIHKTFVFDNRTYIGFAVIVIGGLWSLVCYPGLLQLQVKAVFGERPEAGSSFKSGLRRLFPLVGLFIAMGILIGLGLSVFVIPGLMLYRGLYLAEYYIVDQKLSLPQALRRSWEDSKPNAGYIWGIIGVSILFSFVSLSIGTIPVFGYLLALVVRYIYFFAPPIRYCQIAKNYVLPVMAEADG